MRIVVSHVKFGAFAGTETYMLTVAQQLERLGHSVTIHADQLGPMAEFARSQGTCVVDSLTALPESCDAVLAQDAAVAFDLANRYPDAVRLFVMHGPNHALVHPPPLPDVCHAVVVLNDRVRRHAEQRAGGLRVVRLRQPIDIKRFVTKSRVRAADSRPRALLMANNLDDVRREMVVEACESAGVELRELGAFAEPSPQPEHAIAGVEIVITLGRGILEAMAAGRAAYVFGPAGGDGWVTPESYPTLEGDGFGGRATALQIDTRRMASELADWSPEMGEINRDLVWVNHDSDVHATELLELIGELGARPTAPVRYADELARLVRLEWYNHANYRVALSENRRLQAEVDALEALAAAHDERARALAAELADTQAVLAEVDGRLDVVLRTRRYRFACWLAQPVERLRRIAAAVRW